MNEIKIFNNPQFGDIRTVDEKLKGTYLGVVYVLEYGSMVKIGSTNAPYRRLWTLCHQANDYGNCGTGRFAFTIGHTNFRENEKTVHNLFKDKRKIGSELFDITFEQVIGELKKLDFQDKTNEIKRNNKIFVNGMKNFITGASPKISFEKKMPLMQCDISVISNVHGYLDTNNTIWLNAEDVAKGFGFTTVATSGNDTVRWSRVNKYLKEFGYNQEVSKDSYLPENMVYRLGFKANNATARKFQSVLADEVLPSIRKTGGYIATNADMTDAEILAKAVLVAQTTIDNRNERIKQLEIENGEQKTLIAQMQKGNDYLNTILQSKGTLAITQIAADYGMSAIAFNKKLCEMHIQHKVNGQWILYSEFMGKGYVHSRTISFYHKDGRPDTRLCTEFTQRGRLFLYDALKEIGLLPLIERYPTS